MEPGERGRSVGEQRITWIVLARNRLRNGPSGERVNERQNFAVTGRAALVRTAAVDVLNLAIGFLARAANHALAGRGEADHDVGHRPLELAKHIAAKIDVARILRSKVNSDDQRLTQFGERLLIGGGKGVMAVLGEVDR